RTDGLFSHSPIDAGFCSQSVNQFVHQMPRALRLIAGYFVCDFILSACVANYKLCRFWKPQFGRNRS
ncbi:hypothetical protein, partial [Escherichia coli]|uniref:hypothetical protein n=1 Tax=Escherichia coli TaxID=562 RepID=UPI0019D51740